MTGKRKVLAMGALFDLEISELKEEIRVYPWSREIVIEQHETCHPRFYAVMIYCIGTIPTEVFNSLLNDSLMKSGGGLNRLGYKRFLTIV